MKAPDGLARKGVTWISMSLFKNVILDPNWQGLIGPDFGYCCGHCKGKGGPD